MEDKQQLKNPSQQKESSSIKTGNHKDLNYSNYLNSKKFEYIKLFGKYSILFKTHLENLHIPPDLSKTYDYALNLDHRGRKQYQGDCNQVIKEITDFCIEFNKIYYLFRSQEKRSNNEQDKKLYLDYQHFRLNTTRMSYNSRDTLRNIIGLSKRSHINNNEKWNEEINKLSRSLGYLRNPINFFPMELDRINQQNTLIAQLQHVRENKELSELFRKDIRNEILEFLLRANNSNVLPKDHFNEEK